MWGELTEKDKSTDEKKISSDKSDSDLIMSPSSEGVFFPRLPRVSRKIHFPTSSRITHTKQMLANCKIQGLSMPFFCGMCKSAWARAHTTHWDLPILHCSLTTLRNALTDLVALNRLICSALDTHQNLRSNKDLDDSYILLVFRDWIFRCSFTELRP